MFWIAIALIVLSLGLVKLGALSVMVSFVTFALKVALAIIVFLVGYVLWGKYKAHKEMQPKLVELKRNEP